MRKTHVTLVIIITVLVALAINVLFGNYIAARLATLPVIRNLNLISPRAPIVINNRETVRVSDANDAVETASAVKSKLSLLVYYEADQLVPAGSLLNWTADGYFITSNKAFAAPGKTYAVITNTGEIFPVKSLHADTASSAVLVATDARGLPTVDTVENRELRQGQKLLFVANSFESNKYSFLESYIRTLPTDIANTELDSDRVQRGVGIQAVTPLLPGHAGVTLNGRVVGIWDGAQLLGADALRTFANSFFTDNKAINRPAFGFNYKYVSPIEARTLQLSAGALVTKVTANQPAANAGLGVGDVIISVGDRKVEEGVTLEEILEAIKPNQLTIFNIVRKGAPQTIVITPGLQNQKTP